MGLSERWADEGARPTRDTRRGSQSVAARADQEAGAPPTASSSAERLGHSGCRPEPHSRWMMCPHGTVGCPICHDGLTPHCIACSDPNLTCDFGHDPPAVEMTVEAHCDLFPEQREHLMGGSRA